MDVETETPNSESQALGRAEPASSYSQVVQGKLKDFHSTTGFIKLLNFFIKELTDKVYFQNSPKIS